MRHGRRVGMRHVPVITKVELAGTCDVYVLFGVEIWRDREKL